MPASDSPSSYLDDQRNYVVRRKPNSGHLWSYQIYNSRLSDYSLNGSFCVVVVGNSLSPSQCVIAVPIEYLKEWVLPHTHIDARGRYTFEVNKRSYEFTWRHGLHMQGRHFLVR